MPTRFLDLSLAAMLCLSCGSCGGSGGHGGSSTAPPTTPSSVGNTSVTTITIAGNKGDQSFSPNPAMCTTGQSVVWKNADNITHRIVIPELGVDTGSLAPGATSAPVSLANVSKTYHCALHPSMVGGLNDSTTPTDPGNCGSYGC